MTWNEIQENWTELGTLIPQKWDKIRESDLANINGQRRVMILTLRGRYGWNQVETERNVDEFADGLQLQETSPEAA